MLATVLSHLLWSRLSFSYDIHQDYSKLLYSSTIRKTMENSEKLKNLLQLEMIPDLETAIDELFGVIEKSKKATPAQKEELEELRDMRAECNAIVEDIERDEIEDEEVEALLEELMDIKTQEE